MGKRENTRQSILEKALDLSTEVGLEGLTIGVLAKRVGMSKSGLYAHFSSKEDMQCDVLDAAAERFVAVVLTPALKQPRGIPRLRSLFALWLQWEANDLSGGCPFIAASTEIDDRPGPVREHLRGHLRDVLGVIARAAQVCVEEGHFVPDLDLDQFAYEFWAILLAYHHFNRLMDSESANERARRAFEKIVQQAQPLSQ